MECNKVLPRKDYLSIDELYMALARFISLRCKDEYVKFKEGCFICNDEGRFLSAGYRGLPMGIDYEEALASKLPFDLMILSAPKNAIALAPFDSLKDSKIYTTNYPDPYSANFMIENDIKEIYYPSTDISTKKRETMDLFNTMGIIPTPIADMEVSVPDNVDIRKWLNTMAGIAEIVSMASPDPSTQVGSVIFDDNYKLLGIGYNAFPTQCNQESFTWEREGNVTKYPYVVHAEARNITNAIANLRGKNILTTLFPCEECTKILIQKGIKKIYYISDKYAESEANKVAKYMLSKSGIEHEPVNSVGVKVKRL